MTDTTTQPATTIGHTPGPWTLHLARIIPTSPIFGFSIRSAGKVPYVASVGVADSPHATIVAEEFRKTVTTGLTEAEVEANGRLMAASPELLASIRELLAVVAIQNGNMHTDTNEIQARAAAAIAKATHPEASR